MIEIRVKSSIGYQESKKKKQPPEQLLFVFSNLDRYELLGQLLIIGEG